MRVLLSDVAERITGNVDRHNCDYVYYVGGEHYDSGEIAIYKRGLLDSEKGLKLGFKFHFPFRAGDTLFMARNPHLRKAGMVTYDGICSDASYIIRPLDNDTLDKRYIPLLFQSNAFWQFFEENKSGSVNYLMNWKELQKFEFELPSIERQREIAELAWAVEDCRVKYKKLLTVCDDIVKSRFVEMFGDPILANGSTTLGQIAFMKAGATTTAASIIEENNGSLYPCYGGNGLRGYAAQYTHEGVFPLIGRQGALCGNVKLAKGKFRATEHAVVVEPIEGVNPVWLSYYLDFDKLGRLATGAAQPGLSVKELKTVPISVPSENSQQVFVNFANQVDKSKVALQQSLDDLNATMTAILNEELGTRDV